MNSICESNEIYRNNLAILKERFPAISNLLGQKAVHSSFTLESFATKCGQVNAWAVLDDGRRVAFYEDEDIFKSTAEIMAHWQLDTQDILFCAGMGLGYCPLIAAAKFTHLPQIVVLEPQLPIFETALKSLDLRSLLNYPRLALFVGHDFRIRDIIDQYHFQIFIGKQRVATHAPSRTISGKQFIAIEKELLESIGLTKDLWKTNKELGRDMLSNLMSNLPSLFNGVPLGKMKNVMAGRPAVCVSAGPSLDKALPAIKKIQNQVLIVALDSAVSTLIPAGIQPHFVATCDTRRINFEKLRPYLEHLRKSNLIFALESNPANVRNFPGPQRLAVAGDNIFVKSWLAPALQIDCSLPPVSTVSHTAIYTMMELGADPIVIVGMDMAFPSDKSHARNSVNKYNIPVGKIIEAQGTNGLAVRTYRPMVDYTRQLESVIAKSSHRFINTSLSGLFIQGMQVKSLQEVVDTELDNTFNIDELLSSLEWKFPLNDTDIISLLASKRAEIEIFQTQCLKEIKEAERIIACLQSDGFKQDLEKQIDRLAGIFQAFQKETNNISQLLFSIRLENIREVEIRRLKLSFNLMGARANDRKIEELLIIKDDLTSQLEAAGFFCSLITKLEDYYHSHCELKKEFSIDPKNLSILLKLANLYSEAGEITLAEKAYRQALKHAPDDVLIRLELIRMLAGSELWGSALEQIRKAYWDFPDNPDVNAVKEEIDSKISGIFDRINAAWKKGDKVRSQKLLNEYLLLDPGNPEANRIENELEKHDAKIAPDLPALYEYVKTEEKFDDLLKNAADCLKNLEFEQAIGIFEGLIENFPGQEAVLREKIGDCRLLEQDYKSALWNYAQALGRTHHASGIKAKIADIRRRVDTLPV